MASIYLPPIARKKKVDGCPRHNTSRVFPDMADNFKQEDTSYKSEFIRHNVPPTPQRIASASRKNKPQSRAVTFLRQNPRFVCEPICHVDTTVQREDVNDHSWWPDETVQRPVKKPLYTLNSTSRNDYKNFSLCSSQTGHSLHESYLTFNPPKPKSAVGIVPGYRSSENTNHVSEKISYEHQFNSRLNPGHPVRGKRHGCFVWKVVTPARNNHGRDRSLNTRINVKDVSYALTNTDITDNMDAKSIREKATIVGNNSTKPKGCISKENEAQVMNYAWGTPAGNPNDKTNRPILHFAKQHEQTLESGGLFEVIDQERNGGTKPSKPRHHLPPPPTT